MAWRHMGRRNDRQAEVPVGPFVDVQPYLYRSCAASDKNPPCAKTGPVNNQEWSFSFGNGMQDTDILGNRLYVMVNFSQTVAEALTDALDRDLTGSRFLAGLLAEAGAISSALDPGARAAAVAAFIQDVNALVPGTLSPAQAAELARLAQAS